MQSVNGAPQPVEIIGAGLWFETDHANSPTRTKVSPMSRIMAASLGPSRFGPVFWIVANTRLWRVIERPPFRS